jgi:hypothetical protein
MQIDHKKGDRKVTQPISDTFYLLQNKLNWNKKQWYVKCWDAWQCSTMNTRCTCEKDILALRLFEDNWRASYMTWSAWALHSHSHIVFLLIQSNCIQLQQWINILIWVVWLFYHPVHTYKPGIKYSKSTIINMVTVWNSKVISDKSDANRICSYKTPSQIPIAYTFCAFSTISSNNRKMTFVYKHLRTSPAQ